jgi:delta 1-pyrroline-5-carboxylate dehydrogenase
VFGPVVSLLPYDDVDAVFDAISASRFGLQCGVLTRSLPLALRAIARLRTGGVIVNGTSTWRVDTMPYGGVKDSGIGREGPRYAIREMTDERWWSLIPKRRACQESDGKPQTQAATEQALTYQGCERSGMRRTLTVYRPPRECNSMLDAVAKDGRLYLPDRSCWRAEIARPCW